MSPRTSYSRWETRNLCNNDFTLIKLYPLWTGRPAFMASVHLCWRKKLCYFAVAQVVLGGKGYRQYSDKYSDISYKKSPVSTNHNL